MRGALLAAIPCGVLMLAGCATAPTAPAAQGKPLTCTTGADCDFRWSRAVSWVVTNSGYKIQTQTDSVIQTMGPTHDNPTPAFTVTRVAVSPGVYEFTFGGGCDNLFGCIPTVDESRASFAAYIMAESPAIPPPATPPKQKPK